MMLKHRCAALLIFHNAETPLKNTGDFLHDVETPLYNTFHFLPFPKSSQPAIPPSSLFPKQLRPALVSFFFPPIARNTISKQLFPLLKHQQPFIFLPLLKHHYQQPFISFPDAETPLFNIFHFFPPPPFSHCFHCRNNSVQHLFRPLSVAETPFASNPSSFIHDAETPPFNTF
jgi:hypothetical protein